MEWFLKEAQALIILWMTKRLTSEQLIERLDLAAIDHGVANA